MTAAHRLPEPDASPLRAQRGGLGSTPPTRMDIHTLQRHFWKLDAEQHFTGNETRLYFYWLNLFNAEFWPDQFVRFCKQVEADLGLDDRAHGKARKGLIERGLLFYQEGAKGRAALWSLLRKPARNIKMPRNNAEESEPIPTQIPPHNCEESGVIPSHMPRNNADSNKEETETRSVVVNTNQKNAGAGEPDSSPSPSQKITAPTPVAAPPAPAVTPYLGEGTDASRALGAELAGYWHIRETKDARHWAQFLTFTRTMAAAGRLEEVREQFAAYKAFRELRPGMQRHSIKNILGSEGVGYADSELVHGGCWVAKLAEALATKPKSTGFGPEPAPARAGGAPSNKQKNW